MLTKDELLDPIAALRDDSVVVTCMGVTRPWGRRSLSDLDFASADSAMGHTADFALGIALSQPGRKVICLNGDGSMLMTLGTLVTAAQAAPRNYFLFVVQNGTYEITGNLPIPGAAQVDFCWLARGAGFEKIYSFDDPATYASALPSILTAGGPAFVLVKVVPGTEGPISRSAKESYYLKASLAEWARVLRKALQRRTSGPGASNAP